MPAVCLYARYASMEEQASKEASPPHLAEKFMVCIFLSCQHTPNPWPSLYLIVDFSIDGFVGTGAQQQGCNVCSICFRCLCSSTLSFFVSSSSIS